MAVDAKISSDLKPLRGLDEDGYFASFGSAENMDKYLDLIAKRLAALMNDSAKRGQLLTTLNGEEGKLRNLADLIIHLPEVQGAVTSGFNAAMKAEVSTGQLATQHLANETDVNAFLKLSESLYGLQTHLAVPETGTWDWSAPLPVFRTPILDESVTQYFEGFNPDGSEALIDFEATELPYPLLYIHFDEEFFWKPENAVASDDPDPSEQLARDIEEALQPKHGMWSVISDLVKPPPLFAHSSTHDFPSEDHAECYEDYHTKIVGFEIYEDRESKILGKPEIITNARFEHMYNEEGDDYEWEKYKEVYKKVDKVDSRYIHTSSRWLLKKYPWPHGTRTCTDWDEWEHDDDKDDAHFGVIEEDLPPNDDDKMAKWKFIGTDRNSNLWLNNSNNTRGDCNCWPEPPQARILIQYDES